MKRIGVIIDTLDGEYQRRITENLLRGAVNHDVQLSFFVGSDMEASSLIQEPDRTIFNLMSPGILDGVLMVPEIKIHRMEKEELENYLHPLKNLPVVCIGTDMSSVHSVVLNNRKATEEVLSHVSKDVAPEDICYISGPLNNSEAVERKEAWLDLLRSNGLDESDRNTYEGDFHKASGADAVDAFIEANGRIPGGIVAANDEMAVGAYRRLAALGYHIPLDVILAGFDNIQLATDVFPPITTYNQPIYQLCIKALDALVGLCDGRITPGKDLLEGELVVREFLGYLQLSDRIHGDRGEQQQETIASIADERIPAMLNSQILEPFTALLGQYILPTDTAQNKLDAYSKELLADLAKDIGNETPEEYCFVTALSSLISHAIITEGRHANFNRFMEGLNRLLQPITDDPMLSGRIDKVLLNCSQMIVSGNRWQETYRFQTFRDMIITSRRMQSCLNTATTYEEVHKILETYLPAYNISECYMIQYKRPVVHDRIGSLPYPTMADMTFGIRDGHLLKPQSFVLHNMLPTEYLYDDRDTPLVYMALVMDNLYFGYIVFSMDAGDMTMYEGIRSRISQTFKRLQMTMKRLEAEKALKNVLRELENSNELLRRQSVRDDLTGLYNRRGFYTEGSDYFTKAVKNKESLYLIYGDINDLKGINDNFGHDEGDYAIRIVGDALSACLGEEAIVARMSGDEFTALVKDVADESVMEDYINSIDQVLESVTIRNLKPFDVTISLGYSAYDDEKLQTMDDLMRQADSSLYRAKERVRRKK